MGHFSAENTTWRQLWQLIFFTNFFFPRRFFIVSGDISYFFVMTNKISAVFAREILDSRGNPTVEAEVWAGDLMGRAAVPSGASTGVHEACELRDNDSQRYHGKGVQKAVENVNQQIAPQVVGAFSAENQSELDQALVEFDGTENKSRLGANAILAVSLAAARLAAQEQSIPLWKYLQNLSGEKSAELPRPMMNVLNGGVHADSGLAIQEFMIFPRLGSFAQNLQAGAEIFHTLKKQLSAQKLSTGVGDEGGFAPRIPTVRGALDQLMQAIEASGYQPGTQVELALDAAASEFFDSGVYMVDGESFSAEKLTDFYGELLRDYPLTSLEDSHAEDDEAGFALMQERFGANCQLVGDDLFVTNSKRLERGIEQQLANAILIKVNQIGTLTETLQTIRLAKDHGFGTVISHRSGETEDAFIADLAVGTAAGQIKTGSLSRSDRVGKYNQLLRIGEDLA